jgi:hypothetical protein
MLFLKIFSVKKFDEKSAILTRIAARMQKLKYLDMDFSLKSPIFSPKVGENRQYFHRK